MRGALSLKNLWDASPPPVRTAAGWVLGWIPQRILLGSRFRRALRFVKQADRWSMEQARAYQLEAVRRIVQLAWERTEYYRDSFRAVGFVPGDLRTLDDLRSLPPIDKDTLREHLPRMCARGTPLRSADCVSTGGTSGKPVQFYIGRDRSAIEYAYLVTAWGRAGFRLGMPLAVLRGRVVPPDRHGLRHEYDPLLRYHYYSNFHLTDENMRRYLRHIGGLGRCFLHVYPSAVAWLTTFMERERLEPPANVAGVLAESENVYPEQRDSVERFFNVRYFSCYGHSEKLVLASECEQTHAYHVWPTYGYFELLDESGAPVTTPGRSGEIVGTGFINSVVPFLRYRTGDFATLAGHRCRACGREQTLLEKIQGHGHEGLVGVDGQLISITALVRAGHAEHLHAVQRYQFHQQVPGEAVLRVVLAPGATEKDILPLLKDLEKRACGQLKLVLQCVDDIPLTARGKYSYVVSALPKGEPEHPHRQPR